MFRKPSTKITGAKILCMGETGVGKTKFALSFPKVYAMDSETGVSFYEGDSPNLIGIANTQDFNELSEAMDEITEMVAEDASLVGTLMIDSETKFYQNLTDTALSVEEKKAKKKGLDINDQAISMRGWGRIKNIGIRLQNLKIDLSAKGINVISVSQIEDVKQKVGENFVKIGEKPVMAKNASYDYDIVVKLFVEKSLVTGKFEYKAEILKDRTEVTKIGQIIDNPSYSVWKKFLEGRKGDTIQSELAKDTEKAKKSLEDEDAVAERTVVDRLKTVMGKSEEQKAKALELIKEAKIKNPLSPKDAKELEVLGKIVDTVEAM